MAVSSNTTNPSTAANVSGAAPTIFTIPARRVGTIDILDEARDRLRVIWLALTPENQTWRDDDAIFCIWADVEKVLTDLKALRDFMYGRGE